MELIHILNNAFILYADCEVAYHGRACSTLPRGNYLIIRKNDNSIIVHAGDKSTPRNYQSAGSVIKIDGNAIICERKKETLKIIIHSIINISTITDWSEHCITMLNTEKHLVKKIISNWTVYLPPVKTIHTEYNTKAGPIDILGEDECFHVIEVKRIKVTVNHCTQLGKYIEVLKEEGIDTAGYLAAPSISDKALDYCNKKGYKYIKVVFDD